MADDTAPPTIKAGLRRIDDLIPYARNARTHSPEQVAAIAASIEEFGWTNPILADGKGIIAGHGRQMAARQLIEAGHVIKMPGGEELPPGMVPVIDCTGWSEAKRRAYILRDNTLALQAGWDYSLLNIELGDLGEMGVDLSTLGFSDIELATILNPPTDSHVDPDKTPEPPADPITRAGDVWVLGRHRIICGDSTDPSVVERVLAGATPHLMVTDPPYGVEYDANWRNERALTSPGMGNRAIGAGAVGKVMNDDRAEWRAAWALFGGDVAYVWCASLHVHEVADSVIACGFELRSLIIWAKHQFAISRSDYHWQHEPCLYAVRKGATGHWHGDRKQTTLWQIDKPQKSETGHSTQKPIECMKRPILNNSAPGDGVYDPFSGSGTTLIAAEITGRSCYAIELSPAYVDVAVRRWEAFAGKPATLEGDGRTFAEMVVERSEIGRAPEPEGE